jgi:predicted phosphodiesterase
LVYESKAKLWCFGHSHSPTRTEIGETLCLNNPYGYHGVEVNEDFSYDPVITL